MRLFTTLALMLMSAGALPAQNSMISIHTDQNLGEASPYLYGQFIEYMGRDIEGGIYDPASPLSDKNGIRQDVLEKVKELSPTMIRFPGGTFVKTFHWMDGVGPKDQRRPGKNLIWGGINTFQFGTCEFIEYCRAVGCEPVLVVNMATGTPDEAANWVEYCNGTDDTYYANLRRSHGYSEPFNVKYWALGNEEAAEPDAGRHQDPQKYVTDAWQFIKFMKLTDPSIELIADGMGSADWSNTVVKGLDGAVNYYSIHSYVGTDKGRPYSIFHKIDKTEHRLHAFNELIKSHCKDSVTNWNVWYRFPARQKPARIALDEWGIWEDQDPPYGTTNTYEWRHALATAYYLHAILRCAGFVGMANWAQMVNILAPIMTDGNTSIRQTVFYPLKEYRANTLKEVVATESVSPVVDGKLQALNTVCTIDREKGVLSLFVVNLSSVPINAGLSVDDRKNPFVEQIITMTGERLDAKNRLSEPQKDVVNIKTEKVGKHVKQLQVPAESIQIVKIAL